MGQPFFRLLISNDLNGLSVSSKVGPGLRQIACATLRRAADTRHGLTRVVGARDDIDVPVAEDHLAAGETLLMCTDGLHGQVDDDVIADILLRAGGPRAATTMLIDAAMERGGRDNVTAVVLTRHDTAE